MKKTFARVLLISSNTTREPTPVYPLGMALVASSLKAVGHKTRQFDLLHDRDSDKDTDKGTETDNGSLEAVLADFKPDIVGISVRNIDNVDSLASHDNWYLSRLADLVSRVKAAWKVPVVLGGPAFSIMPETILEFSGADFGVVGEGEKSFNLLIDNILKGIPCPKITSPISPQIDGQEFFAPEYEKNLVDFYMDQSGMVNYQTKRGCPFGCNYCSYPLIEGRKFRRQDPEFVVDNLLRLKKEFNVHTIFFTDSIFNDPGGHFLEIAEQMVKKELNMKWAAYFRPDKISQANLSLLKQSGLHAMEVGSDAACDATLAGINKNFDFEAIQAYNQACAKAEIPCAHFFMFGGPNETHDTVEESLANIETLNQSVVFVFSGIRILPNTGIASIARDQGIISAHDDLIKPRYYISPEIDKDRMDARIEQAFFRRKDRFFPPEKGQIRMKALQAFGFKGLLWDMIVQAGIGKPRKRPPMKKAAGQTQP